MELKKTIKITGIIVVKTGLHIGTSSDSVEIGGCDSPVVKNPLTMEPYIPGSSLKGKMRALYEMTTGKMSGKGGVCSCLDLNCPVCSVFGSACTDSEIRKNRKPTRLIVRDAFLSEESKKLVEAGRELTEMKYENNINRITAKATPRVLERVLPEIKFDFEMVFKKYDGDDETWLNDVVFKSMHLLQNDYLGGGGSRGNGKIEFINVKQDEILLEEF